MKKIAIILFVFLTAVSHFANAQKNLRSVDSLDKLISTAPDTLLPRLYYQMSMESRFNNSLLGIQYALKSLDEASNLGDIFYQVEALQALASNEKIAKMPESSIKHYKEALQLSQKYQMGKLEAECYNKLALMYQKNDSLELAQEYNDRAFNIAKQLHDSVEISNSYLNLGIIMNSLGKTELAIGYLRESMDLRKKFFNLHSYEYMVPIWHIMDIYMNMGEYDKAKNLAYIILSYNIDNDWHDLLAKVWYKLAQVYYKNHNLDSAIVFGKMSFKESIESMEPQRVDFACKLLDSIYISKGDYDSAAEICRDYIAICDTLFNTDLNYQIKTIQFTSEYQDHERHIAQEEKNHKFSLAILAFVLIALIGSGCFFYFAMSHNRKIQNLNKILSKQRDNMDHSLRYAHALQRALLPKEEEFGSVFSDKFLIYIPRDIVSGDFYWRFSDKHHEILVVADCTGHGIPGAMLTMLGTSILHDIAITGLRDAALFLEKLRARIKYLMAVNSEYKIDDGMDISLVIVNKHNMEMEYAGAFNNLVYIRDGKMCTFKASRCPIGEYIVDIPFNNHKLKLQKGDEIYLMSDGYSSQFGGKYDTKIGQRKLLELILENHNSSMEELSTLLKEYFYKWKGQLDSVDDVTIAGFRV